MLNLAEIFA